MSYQGNSIPSRCQNFPVSSNDLLMTTFQSFSAASTGSTASGIFLMFCSTSACRPRTEGRAGRDRSCSEERGLQTSSIPSSPGFAGLETVMATHIIRVEIRLGESWMQHAHNDIFVLEFDRKVLEEAVHSCFRCSVGEVATRAVVGDGTHTR